VLALAYLAGRTATELWARRWETALRMTFPKDWAEYAARVGAGLRELLQDPTAFEEAWFTCDYGLLNGQAVDQTALRAVADRLIGDAIEPLEEAARAELSQGSR
jgi:hypothetical protein